MYEDILKEIGLSTNEAKVYESLVGLEKAHVDLVAVKSKVHRRNIYDCIAKLTEKGLISQVVIGGKKHYRAIHPSRLLDIAIEKQNKIKSILPDLEKRFSEGYASEQAYIYKGVTGFKNYMQDIVNVGEDGFYIGAKGGWYDERLKHHLPSFLKKSGALGLKHYCLFDCEMKKQTPPHFDSEVYPHKYLPAEYSTNSAIDIFGDHVVTFTGLDIAKLDDDLTQFVIISRKLADSYRTWFKCIWNLLPGGKFPRM